MNTNVRLLILTLCLAPVVGRNHPGQVVKATVTMGEQVTRPKPLLRATVRRKSQPATAHQRPSPQLSTPLIPTEIKLEESKQVAEVNVIYPKGVPRKFAFSDPPFPSKPRARCSLRSPWNWRPKRCRALTRGERPVRLSGLQRPRLPAPGQGPADFSFKVARRVAAARRAQ